MHNNDLQKVCKGCALSLPFARFHAHPQMADGRLNFCKSCVSARNKARYATKPEQKKRQARAYHAANRDRISARLSAKWRDNAEFRALRTARHRAYAHANRDKVVALHAAYAQAHPERIQHYNKTWRAKSFDVPVGLSLGEWQAMLGAVNGCAYCGSHDRVGIDHMVPLSRGGDHVQGNVVPCCLRCNASKFNLTTVEWLASDRKRAALALGFLADSPIVVAMAA